MITPDLIDEAKAAECLADMAGVLPLRCPRCGTQRTFSHSPCRCGKCGKKFTWRTGTIFEGAKLTAAQIILLFDRFALGQSDKETAANAGVSIDTVKVWRFKYSLLGVDDGEFE